ncbi:GNAT family acetyltransferase [Apiospora hydei]|uniref:GNAT family acetyltransferase n=1 Tax=Apiospora hydei TaxID=1337664 RepID=A0ABR1XA69_9PEZI
MSGEIPVGVSVDTHAAEQPQRQTLDGRFAKLEPLQTSHAQDLYKYLCGGSKTTNFTYLGLGPFDNEDKFAQHIANIAPSQDPFYFAVITKQALGGGEEEVPVGSAVGYISLLNIDRAHRTVEIGWVTFSPRLQRTTVATEVFYLLMEYCMDGLGNRRLEWKCDALNAPSRRAAERLGFAYEGTFRKHRIVRGRNRDTAWFSIVDDEWSARKRALLAWLAPENFEEGRQVRSLDAIRKGMEQ